MKVKGVLGIKEAGVGRFRNKEGPWGEEGIG